MSENNGTRTPIQLTPRDWIIIIALFGSTLTGGAIFGGTPGQTTSAIDQQTRQLSEDLRQIQRLLNESSRLTQANAANINRIDAQIDSLRKLTMDGIRNLDGYFRGRLDQLRPVPDR